MKRTLLVAATFALGIVAVPALSSENSEIVEGPRVHWDYSSSSRTTPITEYLSRLSGFLDRRTGGQFTMEVHRGTLSPLRANLDGLKIGAFHGGSFCAAWYPGKLPAHTGLDLPFLPITSPHQLRHVTHDYFDHPVLRAEREKWNSRFFMSSLLPLYEVLGKGEPPKSLQDWDGMRIRALGQQGKAMEKLGAVPTNVSPPEIFGALDRGLLDAASLPYYAHNNYGTWELGTWFTSGLAVGSIACGALFSNDAWNELPDQYKALLDEFVNSDIGYELQIKTIQKLETEAPPLFLSKGLTEVVIDPAERAAFEAVGGRPVWDAWVQEMNELGYDGQELLDTILTAAEKYKGS